MHRFKIGIVIITITQICFVFGELSIDQKIREGNRKPEKDIRLVGGNSALEGRVEIRYNNTWGTVCDDGFDRKAAKVICHMLGYRRSGARSYNRAAYGEGKGPIWLDELQCRGNETSLKDCNHLPWGSDNDCGHKEDAGVKCNRKKKVERRGMFTLELDMVSEEKKIHKIFYRNKSKRKIAIKGVSNYWNREIFYVMGEGIDTVAELLIRDALDEWESFTCLHFSKDVLKKEYNKIVFTSNKDKKGCASIYVGMKQGSQEIHIGKRCLHRDIILHEVGHALGLYHEHSRADRDSYIKINYENVEDDYKNQFEKRPKDEYEDFNKPYDYKSIMHYGQFFFSKEESQDLITIETLKPEFQDIIGKAKHPSFLDYKIVNTMYECSARCDYVECPVGGFLGKECNCYCEGNGEDRTVMPCFKKDDCPKPSINLHLFEIWDKRDENLVNLSSDSYPDGTVFNVYSKNSNCSNASQFKCDNGKWNGQTSNCPVELEIEFAEGTQDEGLIEVILNGQRGLICDDDWDDTDATVACRMMGFAFGKAGFENIPTVNESLLILMDEVKCSGNESTLSECKHNGWGNHDCQHTEAATIICFSNKDTEHIDLGLLRKHECGKIPLKGLKRRKRELQTFNIVEGTEAVKGKYPWLVEIQRMRGRWVHWCGGTIITSHWILSAAHCFDDLSSKDNGISVKMNYKDFRVVLGDHDLTQHDDYEQTFHIEYLVKHWQYSADRIYADYDIALLKIDSVSGNGAVFNSFVQAACLPREYNLNKYGKECEVSGWGKTFEFGEFSSKLRSAKVPVINENKCKQFYKSYPIDTQRMICAGDVKIGIDSCQGDSGGPLVCDINGRNTVIGITSWGEGCGRPNAPGIYTKVATFVSWIEEQKALHDTKGRPALQVRIDKTRLEVEEGRTARFVCTITGTSEEMTYILSWSKQGGQMPAKAKDQNGVLVIPNAQKNDAGNYVCMGSGMTSKDEAVTVLIVSDGVDQAPTVRIEPRYHKADEGTSVRFKCIATGEPTPRIEWYRGSNREMNPEATISSDGVFRIPRVRLEDESDYYCKATNDLGTAELRTILYVTRVDRPETTIIVRQTKYVSIVGETARLECYAEDATGRVTLFWSRATGLPSGSSQDNGILTIPNVQPNYAGNYVCTGTETDSGRVSTAVAVLEVKIEEETEAPTVSLEPEKVTIPMGTTGTLRCKVTGKPEPKVIWIKSREELSSNHQVNGNVLRITQATMADRGIYVCRAENSAGIDQDWTVVEVERRMRPKIDLYPNTQRVTVGSTSVMFHCIVMDGEPHPTITWSRVGGAPMPADKIETMEIGVIMFKQVTQAEQGGYICAAENEMGTTTATATLIVEGPPTITIQPSKTVYALTGQRVTLKCIADGDPLPAVYWSEPERWNHDDYTRPASLKAVMYGTAIVDITNVQKGDQGTYTCVASNTGGSIRDRVQLVVREGETRGVSISGPSTLSVVEGQSMELICTATELRNPVIRWRRREGVLPAGYSLRNGVLTLPRFKAEYAGEYICSTTVQQQSYEASVFINITVPPSVVVEQRDMYTEENRIARLRCDAAGSPAPLVRWEKEGDQLPAQHIIQDGVLTIYGVREEDAGRYICTASSSSGSSRDYAFLHVTSLTTLLPGCVFNGKLYKFGESFQPSPCEHCFCYADQGRVCAISDCAPPPCVDAVHDPTKCCPTCPNGENCRHQDGTIIKKGDVYRPYANTVCKCHGSFHYSAICAMP